MRYAVALLVAGLVIAALAAFSWWGCTLPERLARAADLPGANVRLPDHVLTRMAVARFLAITWQAWVPAVVLVSLAAAALFGRPGPAPCAGQRVADAGVGLGDPRLNGGHLEVVRRVRYDAAVDELLDGRGPLTALFDPLARPPAAPRGARGSGPPPPGGAYALVGLADGRRHRLRVGINALGRYSQNDLVLTPICVSRRHCLVLVHARGGCEVYDTASRNGTCVNGRRVGRADLRPGDVLALAGQQFLLTWVGPDGEALPPAEWPETADLEALPSAG